jgi:hypothetical protein
MQRAAKMYKDCQHLLILDLNGCSSGRSTAVLTCTVAVCSLWMCGKVKFSLEQAMKTQRGSRGIAVLFL